MYVIVGELLPDFVIEATLCDLILLLKFRYEAIELRDADKGTYLGNGVSRAVKNINEKISEALIGMDPTLQSQIDQAMIDLDKTEKKVTLSSHQGSSFIWSL